MPIIKILNRDYQIACGEGQESKLYELASRLDKKIHDNAKIFKGANEVTLIILTSLMLEDAVHNLENNSPSKKEEDSESLKILAERVEKICDKLK